MSIPQLRRLATYLVCHLDHTILFDHHHTLLDHLARPFHHDFHEDPVRRDHVWVVKPHDQEGVHDSFSQAMVVLADLDPYLLSVLDWVEGHTCQYPSHCRQRNLSSGVLRRTEAEQVPTRPKYILNLTSHLESLHRASDRKTCWHLDCPRTRPL